MNECGPDADGMSHERGQMPDVATRGFIQSGARKFSLSARSPGFSPSDETLREWDPAEAGTTSAALVVRALARSLKR